MFSLLLKDLNFLFKVLSPVKTKISLGMYMLKKEFSKRYVHFLLQLKDAFEIVSDDNASNKTALLAAQQKDEKSSEMIAELTAVSSAIKILSFQTVTLGFLADMSWQTMLTQIKLLIEEQSDQGLHCYNSICNIDKWFP